MNVIIFNLVTFSSTLKQNESRTILDDIWFCDKVIGINMITDWNE